MKGRTETGQKIKWLRHLHQRPRSRAAVRGIRKQAKTFGGWIPFGRALGEALSGEGLFKKEIGQYSDVQIHEE